MIDTIDRMFSKVGQLYGRQSFAIDEGDASAWASTFAPDGLFVSPSYPDPVSGREALETFARRIYTDSRAAGPPSTPRRHQPDGVPEGRREVVRQSVSEHRCHGS